ncbi:MAG: diadenylate cyclase [Paenibacillus dendritiformis]|uniref:diadenylate cyclase n=1 Tax=uncultured Paenibacillus sp. TaxID=227322 RepID=UPI0025E06277|nr:diadenylate cyclase [uncultured Paenibacillus sp.]MDU5144110.1 diadenylate cyclase [Paenibacillus dendritiformis]
MENNCKKLSPEYSDVYQQFQYMSTQMQNMLSSMDQEGIDILKNLRLLSQICSDTGKLVSAYHLSRLLVPYTNQCNEIFKAIKLLSAQRKGALIVIEREDKINDWITTGTPLSAKISSTLLVSIFHVGSPLHDGAVLIRNNTIVSAANVLPLTRKLYKNKLGTRHRAAIGLSEKTDALTFIVSEETGGKSFTFNGSLYGFEIPDE